MKELIIIFLFFIIGCSICHHLGWYKAHRVIKEECLNIGLFFVGETTFECKVKK